MAEESLNKKSNSAAIKICDAARARLAEKRAAANSYSISFADVQRMVDGYIKDKTEKKPGLYGTIRTSAQVLDELLQIVVTKGFTIDNLPNQLKLDMESLISNALRGDDSHDAGTRAGSQEAREALDSAEKFKPTGDGRRIIRGTQGLS